MEELRDHLIAEAMKTDTANDKATLTGAAVQVDTLIKQEARNERFEQMERERSANRSTVPQAGQQISPGGSPPQSETAPKFGKKGKKKK